MTKRVTKKNDIFSSFLSAGKIKWAICITSRGKEEIKPARSEAFRYAVIFSWGLIYTRETGMPERGAVIKFRSLLPGNKKKY